jgi:aquaporin Z
MSERAPSNIGGRRALLALEFPGTEDFDDPKLEWRRLFSELLGTFFLVLVGAGGAVVNAKSGGAISRTAAVSAPGLMVMAIILFMGAVSGAHLNPAVSIAFAARGDFPWQRVPGYIVMQLIGSTLAVLFLWALLGQIGGLGATEPGSGATNLQAMMMSASSSAPPRPLRMSVPSRRSASAPTSSSPASGPARSAGLR